jgi:hypothetical protein
MSLKIPESFWLRYLLIMGVDTILVFTLSLLFGGIEQMSNFYFISSFFLLLIAVVPVFTEVGGSIKAVGKHFTGQDAREFLRAQEAKVQSGAQLTYLFGLAGLTAFVLAFVFI